MKESVEQAQIMLDLSNDPAIRVFRNNTGTGWQGVVYERTPTRLTLVNPRPLHAGLCIGSSDLIGWKSIEVTPDMVGKNIAIFVAIEVKAKKGVTSDAQKNFIDRVKAAGGRAGIARNTIDAINILNGE